MYEPTHLDLFSGIGGFSLAFEAEGFKTIGFSEIDPFACRVLKARWPDVPNFGDVRNVPTLRCDVITGGFPCQPFSQSRQNGKPKGKSDDRYLWPAMLDVIKRCGPTWVLGENVNGFIDLALDESVSDLEAIGYKVQPLVIPASALGAIHRRERVWILAHAESERCAVIEEIQNPTTGKKCSSESKEWHWIKPCLPELAASNERAESLLCEQPTPAEQVPSDSRGNDGLSEELDAIKCYGNAIVPQIAQVIAREISKTIM